MLEKQNLKKGMYVRINSNVRKICIGISKVVKIFNDTVFVEMSKFDLPISFEKDEISDFKNNLIDLIEVGDYVNGYVVLDVTEQYIKLNNPKLNYDVIDYERIFKNKYSNMAIRDVVTKEQFESQKYIVESE